MATPGTSTPADEAVGVIRKKRSSLSLKRADSWQPISPDDLTVRKSDCSITFLTMAIHEELAQLETLPLMGLGSLSVRDLAVVSDAIISLKARLTDDVHKQSADYKNKCLVVQNVEQRFDDLNKKLQLAMDNRKITASGDEEEDKRTRKWSIIHVPYYRRIQTFSVIWFSFIPGLFLWITLFLILLWNPLTFPLAIAYLVYMYISAPKFPVSNMSKWVRDLSVWKHFRDYFPIRLRAPFRDRIDPKKNYLLVYSPHGVASFGAGQFLHNGNSPSELLGINVRVCTLGVNFWIPLWREFLIRMGGQDASKKTIMRTLSNGPGESCLLVVGGAEEALNSEPHQYELTLKKRMGFLKIALQTGSPLIPVFGFGESNTYNNWGKVPKTRKLLRWIQKKLGFALLLISGRGIFDYTSGPLPFRRRITAVVGKPVEVTQKDAKDITEEDLKTLQSRYMDALFELYEEYKDVYACDRLSELHVGN